MVIVATLGAVDNGEQPYRYANLADLWTKTVQAVAATCVMWCILSRRLSILLIILAGIAITGCRAGRVRLRRSGQIFFRGGGAVFAGAAGGAHSSGAVQTRTGGDRRLTIGFALWVYTMLFGLALCAGRAGRRSTFRTGCFGLQLAATEALFGIQ